MTNDMTTGQSRAPDPGIYDSDVISEIFSSSFTIW